MYDSDGYTNLRREKNTDSKIITTINTSEEIDIIDNTDKWFLVETKEGKLGYVHNSRIRYKNGNESISGKWNANSECENPIGIEIMKNEELIICVEPNQYYIHLSKVNSNDNIISYRLKSITGPVGEDVFSEAYINDSTVVTLERKDNFKIKLNWLGYYNKINGERQYSEALISNQNPVILYKCDK
nr:SH3 domain-containing protein [Cellulophaga baltica]